MFIFSGFSKLHLISQRCFYNFFFSFRYSTVLKMDLIILLIFHFNLQAGGGSWICFLCGNRKMSTLSENVKQTQGQTHFFTSLTNRPFWHVLVSSLSFCLSISNQEFNLQADSAHEITADLATHHGRITSHNYTVIMAEIQSALF